MAIEQSVANVSVSEDAGMFPVYRRYRAEVSDGLLDQEGWLINWLIDLTLGTLGGQHLDIRVLPAQSGRLTIAVTEPAGRV